MVPMVPEDLKYTREHEWVRVEGGTATVGITAHAQQEMGDLVFVELPKIGTRVEAGKPLGAVESVKAVSEVFSPVTGEVVDVNAELADRPELVNQDPYGSGWLARLRVAGDVAASSLMTAAAYREWVEQSGH